MRKILSIIIPAYNVEKYIKRCISSLITDKTVNKIEILIINDGSIDHTADIVKKYCKKYPNTCFLYNKENGGHGSGINWGIRYATGKYFKILDGDDWLNTKQLEDFLLILEEKDVDIVASDFLCIQDNSDKVIKKIYCSNRKEQYGTVCYFSKGEINSVIKMHAFTIRTEILKNMNRKIDERCFYVDCEYITYPIPYVESVYYYSGFVYMYRLGRNGQSMDIKSMQKNRKQHMQVLNSLLSFYGEVDVPITKKRYIEKSIGQVVQNQFQIYISMGNMRKVRQEVKNWDYKLKEEYPTIYNSIDKNSIKIIRKTNYYIMPLARIAYRIIKKRG